MSKDGDRFSETAVLHTKLPFSKKDPFVDEDLAAEFAVRLIFL